jgi:SAM-dependent methyltransferase
MGIAREPSFGRWWIDLSTRHYTEARTRSELDFIVSQLRVDPGQRVLDVGCNSGRHTRALAARGYDVTGVDAEPQAIEIAKEMAAGLPAEFLCLDAAAMELDGFDAALCVGTSLGFHETDEGDQAQLDAIARALVPGGAFFLEITSLFAQEYGAGARQTWERLGDVLVFDRGMFDPLTCRAHHVTEYRDGTRSLIREERYRVYAPPEVVKMLRLAGFEIERVYGDFGGGPFTLRSGPFIAVCRKGT